MYVTPELRSFRLFPTSPKSGNVVFQAMLHNNQLDTLTQKSFRIKRILIGAIAGVTVLPSIILDVSVTTVIIFSP